MSDELREYAKKFGIEYHESGDLSNVDEKLLSMINELTKIDIDEDEIEDLDVVVEREEKRQQRERELLAQEIVKQQGKEDKEVLTKEDVQEILGIKDNGTILRLFRVMVKNGYATKLGKSYIITKKNFEKFLKHLEGQEFEF